MSVFGKIKDAIFGRHAEAAENPAGGQSGVNSSAGGAPVPPTTPASTPAAPQSAPSGASPQPGSAPTQPTAAPGAPAQTQAPAGSASAQPAPAGASATSVDVERIMDQAVKAHGQKLDWRHSIVDMMKALDLDSSLAERKELASELGYDGDANDSAQMNVWLHKALMKKLAENGGKVPAGLAD